MNKNWFFKLENGLFKAIRLFINICLFLLMILVALQIVGRFFNINQIMPHDEVISLVFVWFVFVGSALLIRDESHIKVELFNGLLAKYPLFKKVHSLLIHLLNLVFLVLMLQSANTLNQMASMQVSQMLQWSQTVWFSSIWVCAVLMILYTIIKIVTILFATDN